MYPEITPEIFDKAGVFQQELWENMKPEAKKKLIMNMYQTGATLQAKEIQLISLQTDIEEKLAQSEQQRISLEKKYLESELLFSNKLHVSADIQLMQLAAKSVGLYNGSRDAMEVRAWIKKLTTAAGRMGYALDSDGALEVLENYLGPVATTWLHWWVDENQLAGNYTAAQVLAALEQEYYPHDDIRRARQKLSRLKPNNSKIALTRTLLLFEQF